MIGPFGLKGNPNALPIIKSVWGLKQELRRSLGNSRHLATLPLVFPPNDVWVTSVEIPCWWRVTTQTWVMLLIGWIKFPTRYGISALVSQTSFGGENSGSAAKCRLFSQANFGAAANWDKITSATQATGNYGRPKRLAASPGKRLGWGHLEQSGVPDDINYSTTTHHSRQRLVFQTRQNTPARFLNNA